MYLGIDLGTSGVKAVITENGRVVAEGHSPLTVQRPQALWSEQAPSAWWTATEAAVRSLPADMRAAVKGIGLSGQMHGATLLDAADSVLRPAILWNDGRSSEACKHLETIVPDLPVITGNRAMPGFTAPKVEWVRQNEPDIFAKLAKVLLPKDYLRLMMTGEYASDMSDSAGTGWLDPAARDWSDIMLDACGLTRGHMPSLHDGPDVTGQLMGNAAAHWGMARVPVVAGGGDNAAGAVGVGTVNAGDAFLSLGTSGVIFVASDVHRAAPDSSVHAFCHALPQKWHQMSVILSAASAVDWASIVCGFSAPGHLYEATAARGKLCETETFLPYLSGERTPHNNPAAKGAFFGLTHMTDHVAMGQAALEGVAMALTDGLDALRNAGAGVTSLSVIGGGARSDWWGKILAASLGVPLHYRMSATVGPALGAARLAQIGVGGESVAEVCTAPPIDHTITPDAAMRDRMLAKLETYRALYQATRHLLH